MNDIENASKAYIEYASSIVASAFEASYDLSTVFNGLAVATASMIIDSVDEGSEVLDETLLEDVVAKYIATLRLAVEFAREQLEAGVLISENDNV